MGQEISVQMKESVFQNTLAFSVLPVLSANCDLWVSAHALYMDSWKLPSFSYTNPYKIGKWLKKIITKIHRLKIILN